MKLKSMHFVKEHITSSDDTSLGPWWLASPSRCPSTHLSRKFSTGEGGIKAWYTLLAAVDREDKDTMEPNGMHCCGKFLCD